MLARGAVVRHPTPTERVSLDDMASGAAPLPPEGAPLLLVCSKGPKSLVALDVLAARERERAFVVDGGITAWDLMGLPTQSTAPEEGEGGGG